MHAHMANNNINNNNLHRNHLLLELKQIHMQLMVAMRIMSRFGTLACSKILNKLKVPQARDVLARL